MSRRPIHVETVRTPLNDIEYGAADAAGLDPEETDVVSASVTADGQLEMTLEGPRPDEYQAENGGKDE